MGDERRKGEVWLITARSQTTEALLPVMTASGALHVEVLQSPRSVDVLLSLAGEPEIGGIILDLPVTRERTDENGAVTAALSLREARPQLAIMLLTSAAERELAETEEVFDMVVDRDVALSHWPVYETRLLRDMGRWGQALDERNRRLSYLVDRTFTGDATTGEHEELARLRADVERPFAATIEAAHQRWIAELDAQDARLARLEEISAKLDRALSGELSSRIRRPA